MFELINVLLQTHFNLTSLSSDSEKISSAVYLQVSIISQALIFVTRSRSWSFLERPGVLLMCAFVIAQLVKFLNICSSCKGALICYCMNLIRESRIFVVVVVVV